MQPRLVLAPCSGKCFQFSAMGRGLKTQGRCSKVGGWVGMSNKIPRFTLQRQETSFLGMTRMGKEVTPKGLGRDPKTFLTSLTQTALDWREQFWSCLLEQFLAKF